MLFVLFVVSLLLLFEIIVLLLRQACAIRDNNHMPNIVAIFYPFSQFCEIGISLLSLQKQPNTAPHLFQRGVDYGKYAEVWVRMWMGGNVDG